MRNPIHLPMLLCVLSLWFAGCSPSPPNAVEEVSVEQSGPIEELGPLEVTLQLPNAENHVVPVTLESHVTEVGTLELWCVARDQSHRWKLELNVRERTD